MVFPAFFDAVPGIDVRDPLANFLGASDDGILHYGYADAVRLAGHSCPTVASAYWMTRQALRALFGDQLAERGGVRVEFAAAGSAGATGVIANVVSLLTGAAADMGFQGLAGQFKRRNLLSFGADIPLEMRYTRLDGQGQIDAMTDLRRIPAALEMGLLMQRCLSGEASLPERNRFRELWQERVRAILLDHGDDPSVFVLRKTA